jgi:hypothetical protein
MPRMTASAWNVYVYLCSRYQGEPVEASVPVLQSATGAGERTVIEALRLLTQQKLIIRHHAKGNRSNRYSIPGLPAPPPLAAECKAQPAAAIPPVTASQPKTALQPSTAPQQATALLPATASAAVTESQSTATSQVSAASEPPDHRASLLELMVRATPDPPITNWRF